LAIPSSTLAVVADSFDSFDSVPTMTSGSLEHAAAMIAVSRTAAHSLFDFPTLDPPSVRTGLIGAPPTAV
jgi:hypothetical protein